MFTDRRLERAEGFLGEEVVLESAFDAHQGITPMMQLLLMFACFTLVVAFDPPMLIALVVVAVPAMVMALTRRNYLIAIAPDSVFVLRSRGLLKQRLTSLDGTHPRGGAIGEPAGPLFGARISIGDEPFWVVGPNVEAARRARELSRG